VSEPVLDGLKGVDRVNSDFHGSTERNTVWYDPAIISIDKMEKALKEAGLYLALQNKKGEG
jgi:copper chaperone CopZ